FYGFGDANDPIGSTAGVLLDRGASIVADPVATVTLSAFGPVTALGSIIAPGGTISLANNPGRQGNASQAQAASDVWIGPEAVLDVSGTFIPDPRVAGYSTGTVLDGGTMNLSAGTTGTIIVQPGAELNLQGAEVLASSNLIQVSSDSLGDPRLVGLTEWSNGGNLTLNGKNIYFRRQRRRRGRRAAPHRRQSDRRQ